MYNMLTYCSAQLTDPCRIKKKSHHRCQGKNYITPKCAHARLSGGSRGASAMRKSYILYACVLDVFIISVPDRSFEPIAYYDNIILSHIATSAVIVTTYYYYNMPIICNYGCVWFNCPFGHLCIFRMTFLTKPHLGKYERCILFSGCISFNKIILYFSMVCKRYTSLPLSLVTRIFDFQTTTYLYI